MKYVDKDGNDTYVILWATQPGHYGHLAIGVDNYEYDKKSNQYKPNGTISVYGLFPLNDGYNGLDAIRDKKDRGKFYLDLRTNMKNIKENKFNSNEGNAPDGVLYIKSDYKSDMKVVKSIKKEIKSNKGYRGMTRNCSTFVRDVLNESMNMNVKGEEATPPFKYVTPNQMFKVLKYRKNVTIILDPGSLIKNKFF